MESLVPDSFIVELEIDELNCISTFKFESCQHISVPIYFKTESIITLPMMNKLVTRYSSESNDLTTLDLVSKISSQILGYVFCNLSDKANSNLIN